MDRERHWVVLLAYYDDIRICKQRQSYLEGRIYFQSDHSGLKSAWRDMGSGGYNEAVGNLGIPPCDLGKLACVPAAREGC